MRPENLRGSQPTKSDLLRRAGRGSPTAVTRPAAARYGQSGFSIVSAIFLLVVLSAMGAFMLTFSTVQQMTSTQDLQGAKAYQAARAGIDWGAYQILQTGAPPCSAAGTSSAVTLGGNLASFTLTVSCTSYGPYTEGATPVSLYQITATASSGAAVGSSTYVERQLQATIAH